MRNTNFAITFLVSLVPLKGISQTENIPNQIIQEILDHKPFKDAVLLKVNLLRNDTLLLFDNPSIESFSSLNFNKMPIKVVDSISFFLNPSGFISIESAKSKHIIQVSVQSAITNTGSCGFKNAVSLTITVKKRKNKWKFKYDKVIISSSSAMWL
jgi:hypothetical protein